MGAVVARPTLVVASITQHRCMLAGVESTGGCHVDRSDVVYMGRCSVQSLSMTTLKSTLLSLRITATLSRNTQVTQLVLQPGGGWAAYQACVYGVPAPWYAYLPRTTYQKWAQQHVLHIPALLAQACCADSTRRPRLVWNSHGPHTWHAYALLLQVEGRYALLAL